MLNIACPGYGFLWLDPTLALQYAHVRFLALEQSSESRPFEGKGT